MEHTHPNVTQRKGEKLSGEDTPSDNPPAETTAITNTSQPLAISSAQLEAITNSIGETISRQVHGMFSVLENKLESKLMKIEHDARTRDSGRSSSSSEARSQASHNDEWKKEDVVLSEDPREVDEGQDSTDNGDPGSAEGSESSSSDERAPNSQQPTPGGGNGGDPPSSEGEGAPKKKKKRRASLVLNDEGKPDTVIQHI